MDVQLHKAAREGNMELLTSILERNNRPDLTLSLTPQKNTALHIAVAFGHQQIVREMIDHESSLISQPNSNGDTPLHIAAKAGNLSLTKLLTPGLEEGTSWRSGGVEASSKENFHGYTALHEALRTRHEEVALHLLAFHQQSQIFLASEAAASLLFLASEAGLTRVVNEMMERRSSSNQRRTSNGQNPLHVAVITGNLGVVKLLKDCARHLIEEADDFGKTALHYASTIGYYDDDDNGRKEILKVLIETEPSLAYKSDNDGNYPLLIATMNSPFAAVETILEHCPDSAELVDRSGRNALHIAVRKNREYTLSSLLKRPEFRMVINEPDYAGNTPMHLAAQHKNDEIVELLLKSRNVDLSIKNIEGLTALDVCGYKTEQHLIHDKLKKYGAVPSGQEQWQKMLLMPPPQKPRRSYAGALAEKLFPHIGARHEKLLRQPHASSLAPELISISSNKEAITSTLSIVTTLIATVTFAAALTVPGGYKNDSIGEGVPVFTKSAALKVFLISDSIAFCSSMAATILLLNASANPEDKYLYTSTLNTCTDIAAVAIPATIIAFMAGIYMTTSKESLWLTITSILLGWYVPALVSSRGDRRKTQAAEWKVLQLESKNYKEPNEEVPAGPIPPSN